MAKNQLFDYLKNGLHNANSAPPETSTLAMGFTKFQMIKMDLKKPRLIWYDAEKKQFFDQGDSTKIKKSEWKKISQDNYKKDKPLTNLQYYIPISDSMMLVAEQPVK